MSVRKVPVQKNLMGSDSPLMLLAVEPMAGAKSFYAVGSERREIEEKFKDVIHEELNLGSVVSYVGNKNIPILRLYRYKEAFAFDFVENFLRRFGVDSNDYV